MYSRGRTFGKKERRCGASLRNGVTQPPRRAARLQRQRAVEAVDVVGDADQLVLEKLVFARLQLAQARPLEQPPQVRVHQVHVEVEADGVQQRALRLQHGGPHVGEEERVGALRAAPCHARLRGLVRRRQRLQLRVVAAVPRLEQLIGQCFVRPRFVLYLARQVQRGARHNLRRARRECARIGPREGRAAHCWPGCETWRLRRRLPWCNGLPPALGPTWPQTRDVCTRLCPRAAAHPHPHPYQPRAHKRVVLLHALPRVEAVEEGDGDGPGGDAPVGGGTPRAREAG